MDAELFASDRMEQYHVMANLQNTSSSIYGTVFSNVQVLLLSMCHEVLSNLVFISPRNGMYSCDRVIIDNWSADKYEIKLDSV